MPTTKPITKRYYPSISELITVDDLPEFLHFAENGLNAVLDGIYYKNFQYSKSYRGDGAFYSLDLVSKNIGIDLPFGLRFVLNPDLDGDTTISSFPISLEYQWEVLAFLRSFNLKNFAFTPEAFFQLGLQIFRITEQEVIAQTLNYFLDSDDDTSAKFTELIGDINAYYPSANLVLPPGQEPSVELVAQLINDNPNIPDDVSQVMFLVYIFGQDTSASLAKLEQFYALMVPDGIENYIRELLIPKLRATLSLSAGFEFPNNILKPVTAAGVPIPNTKSRFIFEGITLYADTEAGIGAQAELAGYLSPKLPAFHQIGDTGLLINFSGAKLDLSRKTNIPEADASGYPVDFMGLYVKQAVVTFNRFGENDPGHTSAAITADDLFLGTGGVSGRIALVASGGAIYRKFNSFALELNVFSITFRQNSIISSDIKGKLTINKWKVNGLPAVIDIEAHIRDNGDFNISAKPLAALKVISLPNVLDVEVMSFGMGKEARGFYIEVSGRLNFTANLPVLGDVLPKGIDVKGLRIWDNGDLEFRGGGLVVPKAFRLNVGPVRLEVTNMGLSSYTRKLAGVDRNYRYFSFDGMINTGRAGVNATGNGIKFYFTVDDGPGKAFDSFISIDRIEIDMSVPGNVDRDKAAFILNGYLSVKNPDPAISGSNAGSEYSGAVSFSMPRLKMGGSAGMRLKPSIPAFIVDVGLELSTPIPLGATGLGIYGFRGLIGQHYMPSKTAAGVDESASWWDYYKAKNPVTNREGITINKFADQPGYSVGAGVSIATSFDSGKIFSSKLFLLLGLPDVFLLQGQAGILRSRIGLGDDTDPPFSALIAIDSSSFRANLGVNYRVPEGGAFDGDIFSLSGTLDLAFFFNNASGWYLNVGKDQPESARIRSRILTLFQGYAYLMISSRGIRAGAGARFDFNKRYGIFAVGVGAYLDMGGSISFKPVQIGAFIQIGGYAYLRVLGIGFSLAIQISLAVEAPHPFNITGAIKITVKVFWMKKSFNLELTWRINNNKAPLQLPIPVLQLPDPAKGYLPATATNILSNETFPVNYVTYEISGGTVTIPKPWESGWAVNFNNATEVSKVTIPLDSFIDIELLKPVRPLEGKLGGVANQLPDGYTELLPPQKGIDNQVSHRFELNAVEIYALKQTGPTAGTWVTYNIYEAVKAIVDGNTGPGAINLAELKQGYWQFSEPNRYNKIRLMAQNMFSYSNQSLTASSELDGSNFRRKDLFCFEQVLKETVIDWKDEVPDTAYPNNLAVFTKGVGFTYEGLNAKAANDPLNSKKSLILEANGGRVVVRLPKPVSVVALNVGTNANGLRIDFVKSVNIPGAFGFAFRRDQYMTPVYLSAGQQATVVNYQDMANPIDKIIVTFSRKNFLDYEGDTVIGGHFALPSQFITGGTLPAQHDSELNKAVLFTSVFNRTFTAPEALSLKYHTGTGRVGQWPLEDMLDTAGDNRGILNGDPDRITGFFERGSGVPGTVRNSYLFGANADGVVIPYTPDLKLENGSFAFETTAVFGPFTAGISTLLYKVKEDTLSGERKGFALHLYQDTPGNAATTYADVINAPSFKIWLTFYKGLTSSGMVVTEKYTLDYNTLKLSAKQYKHILVSVNRVNGTVNIYVDRILKLSSPIPAELSVFQAGLGLTALSQLKYQTPEQQRRVQQNPVTQQGLINEVQLLSNNLNKTIQPVWRPDTTFAVVVKTRDVVDGNESGAIRSQIFGFRTAGPIGHFHQQSAVYKKLADQDRSGEFKLASLKSYIDYERSSPDAQSRYDLSKPVFYHDSQIRLFFTKPYLNAMFDNWSAYQGMPAISSSLLLEVLDPFGASVSPQLTWEQTEQAVDMNNYRSLPPDQQLLFLMNVAALQDNCNENPITVLKKIKRGSYHLPDLLPERLYTALFSAVYQPTGIAQPQKSEVHKFSFKTSRFASFDAQASSFILNSTPGQEMYAVYPFGVAFSDTQIDTTLKVLIDNNPDNDPAAVLRYAVKFDRLVYGGLGLQNLGSAAHTIISPVINSSPVDGGAKKILGLLITNPEPFNDPKLPQELLADTLQLTLTTAANVMQGPEQFIYIHSRDTAAIFVTNAAMNLTPGTFRLKFRYKIFDGQVYQNQDYTGPVLSLTTTI